jgi:hypothetical protein
MLTCSMAPLLIHGRQYQHKRNEYKGETHHPRAKHLHERICDLRYVISSSAEAAEVVLQRIVRQT